MSIKDFLETDLLDELLMKEANEIRKQGKKKVVITEKYASHFDPNSCMLCMNYDSNKDICKKGMPNIDPFYIKDHDDVYSCDEWDYVFETEDDCQNSNNKSGTS